MTTKIAPFGLQILDPYWLNAAGAAAPSLRAVAAFDENAFAVGDVVVESGASIGGVAAVSSAFPQIGPDGTTYSPVGGSGGSGTNLLVVVAVAPAVPSTNGASPILPAGPKGSTGMLWVIPAIGREFLIAGDGSTPARGELLGPGEAPLNLFAQNIESGALFARLKYGAPSGSVSGTALDGASFTDAHGNDARIPGGHGDLQVIGFGSGMSLAPRSMYRVRIRNRV